MKKRSELICGKLDELAKMVSNGFYLCGTDRLIISSDQEEDAKVRAMELIQTIRDEAKKMEEEPAWSRISAWKHEEMP